MLTQKPRTHTNPRSRGISYEHKTFGVAANEIQEEKEKEKEKKNMVAAMRLHIQQEQDANGKRILCIQVSENYYSVARRF